MKIQIKNNVDFLQEVIDLIYMSVNYEREEKDVENMFLLYDNTKEMHKTIHMNKIKKYIETFKKNMIMEKEEMDMFFLPNINGNNSIADFLCEYLDIKDVEKLAYDSENCSDDMLRIKLINSINEELEEKNYSVLDSKCSTNDYIKALEKLEFKEDTNWKFIKIFMDPLKYYKSLAKIIMDNKDIFHNAYKEVESNVKEFVIKLEENKEDMFNKLKKNIGLHDEAYDNVIIYPSVARYRTIKTRLKEKKEIMYYGINFDILFNLSNGVYDNVKLVRKLKILSDKSKFEILQLLKEKSMFGQEIAQKLKLTTATVSHHMNSLICANFVYMERKNGKTYFTLNNDEIKIFLVNLNKKLL